MSMHRQNAHVPPLQAHSATRRSCDQLGLCQKRHPACTGCAHHFAPGVISGGPDTRPLLRRWGVRNGMRFVGVVVLATTALASCSYSVGYLSVMLGASL